MRKLAVIVALISLLMLAACSTKIGDIKASPDKYLGKEVTVSGAAQNVIKLGKLSGFTLKDDTGSISVSSQNLPPEGSSVKVKGTMTKDSVFGYYILAKSVS